MNLTLLIIASYIVGAVPFGLIIVKLVSGVDVREHGSGNIGTTNVFRVAGKPAGVFVFLLDVAKGWWGPYLVSRLGFDSWGMMGCGLAAVLGHNASPFLGFKGGKGVATSLGVLIGLSWKVAASSGLLWIVLTLATGIVSIGSIAASISLAPFTLIFYRQDPWARLILALFAGIYSLYKHKGNISRLRQGTEPSFRRKSI